MRTFSCRKKGFNRFITLFLLLILLQVMPFSGYGQWGISLLPGTVIKHTENLRFDPPKQAYGVVFNMPLVNKKLRHWHAYYGFPEVSMKVGYQDFNLQEVLGEAFYCMPELRIYPLKEDFSFQPVISFATGLAYINRKYDFSDNPTNNAISSSLDNVTAFGLGVEYKASLPHRLYTGIRLTHFSNANVKQPNLGVNLLVAELGYAYQFREKATEIQEEDKPRRYFFAEMSGTFALSEYSVPGGPKYPNYNAGFMLGIPISAFQSVLVYPFWQKRDVERVFPKNVFDLEEDEEGDAGEKYAVAIGLENRFGDLAISVFYGRYIIEKGNSSSTKGFNLIRLQYIIHINENLDLAPGLQFKSKQITAQYIGVLLGLRLKK